MSQVFKIYNQDGMGPSMQAIGDLVRLVLQAGPIEVEVRRPKRSSAQSNLMWSMLGDISQQVDWPRQTGNYHSKEVWKHIAGAEIESQLLLPGITVPLVACPVSTKAKPKDWMNQMISQLDAFGTQEGVTWKGHHYG